MNKVKGYRVMANISQKEMAKLIGVSTATYISKEMGNTEFKVDEVNIMLETLKLKLPNQPIEYENIFLN